MTCNRTFEGLAIFVGSIKGIVAVYKNKEDLEKLPEDDRDIVAKKIYEIESNKFLDAVEPILAFKRSKGF